MAGGSVVAESVRGEAGMVVGMADTVVDSSVGDLTGMVVGMLHKAEGERCPEPRRRPISMLYFVIARPETPSMPPLSYLTSPVPSLYHVSSSGSHGPDPLT